MDSIYIIKTTEGTAFHAFSNYPRPEHVLKAINTFLERTISDDEYKAIIDYYKSRNECIEIADTDFVISKINMTRC